MMTFQVEAYTLGLKFPRWTPDGLKAVLTIDGPLGTIHGGDLLLQSFSAKEGLARFLDSAARLPKGRGEWARLLGPIFSQFVMESQTAISPIRLMDSPLQTDEVMSDVQGVSFLPKHHSIYFGNGESYKSLVALWLAGKSGLRTLYLDWELTAGDHRKRLQELFGGDALPENLLYLKSKLPLYQSVDNLRSVVSGEGIQLIIVDSVAFSTNLPAEGSEAALVHFGALEEIGVGSISIAHLTKQVKKADRLAKAEKPFGSTFWHNSARFTLLFERQPSGTVVLSPRKSNLVARPPDVELSVKFGDNRIQIIPMTTLVMLPTGDSVNAILQFVSAHPGTSKTQIRESVGLDTKGFQSVIEQMATDGLICVDTTHQRHKVFLKCN